MLGCVTTSGPQWPAPRIQFFLQLPDNTLQRLHLADQHGFSGEWVTPWTPSTGDAVALEVMDGDDGTLRAMYVVTGRQWTPVPYGSEGWPHGAQQPHVGPGLLCVVEPLSETPVPAPPGKREQPKAGWGRLRPVES